MGKVLSLSQTNPIKINYTVYIEIVINPNNEYQAVKFPFNPDKESLESVIDEMVEALQLNKHLHRKAILESIEEAMKTKKMKIIEKSPIQTEQQKDENIFPPLSPLVMSPVLTRRK